MDLRNLYFLLMAGQVPNIIFSLLIWMEKKESNKTKGKEMRGRN